MPHNAFYHPHAYFWMILVLLFIVTFFLYRANVAKGAKITHMVLRLFYVIMIVTGIALLVLKAFLFTYIIKGLLALLLIYLMEMILVKTKKGISGKSLASYWVLCLAALLVVVLIGYRVIIF
jgi:uncharacterized membrane protein SirB2